MLLPMAAPRVQAASPYIIGIFQNQLLSLSIFALILHFPFSDVEDHQDYKQNGYKF